MALSLAVSHIPLPPLPALPCPALPCSATGRIQAVRRQLSEGQGQMGGMDEEVKLMELLGEGTVGGGWVGRTR